VLADLTRWPAWSAPRKRRRSRDLRQAHHRHGRRRAGRPGGDGRDLGSRPHNIRGERISIDTIPLVGEQELASAVRAVARLPRVNMLVLAGSLMGGDITEAVKEVQAQGLRVISLNQAGSVPDVADLVVSDPTQAGVMAVMAVAETAKFDLVRQLKRRY
jgi:uncharacterized protein with ACT and thioredoxin-like domain